LRAHGADTREMIVYETVAPEIPEQTVAALLTFAPDLILFTSSSTAKNFCARLQGEPFETLKARATFAALGPVTADTARHLGLDVTVEPDQYDVPGLLRAIVSHFGER